MSTYAVRGVPLDAPPCMSVWIVLPFGGSYKTYVSFDISSHVWVNVIPKSVNKKFVYKVLIILFT